jgi:RNA polymerase sigma factor (sigma-70 family)
LGSGGSERLVDRSSSPARAAEQRERGRRIERALASLTAAQRLAIVLRFYAGWTLDEIARQTGSNRVSVYKRIDRGLRRLQRTGGLTVADLA